METIFHFRDELKANMRPFCLLWKKKPASIRIYIPFRISAESVEKKLASGLHTQAGGFFLSRSSGPGRYYALFGIRSRKADRWRRKAWFRISIRQLRRGGFYHFLDKCGREREHQE